MKSLTRVWFLLIVSGSAPGFAQTTGEVCYQATHSNVQGEVSVSDINLHCDTMKGAIAGRNAAGVLTGVFGANAAICWTAFAMCLNPATAPAAQVMTKTCAFSSLAASGIDMIKAKDVQTQNSQTISTLSSVLSGTKNVSIVLGKTSEIKTAAKGDKFKTKIAACASPLINAGLATYKAVMYKKSRDDSAKTAQDSADHVQQSYQEWLAQGKTLNGSVLAAQPPLGPCDTPDAFTNPAKFAQCSPDYLKNTGVNTGALEKFTSNPDINSAANTNYGMGLPSLISQMATSADPVAAATSTMGAAGLDSGDLAALNEAVKSDAKTYASSAQLAEHVVGQAPATSRSGGGGGSDSGLPDFSSLMKQLMAMGVDPASAEGQQFLAQHGAAAGGRSPASLASNPSDIQSNTNVSLFSRISGHYTAFASQP